MSRPEAVDSIGGIGTLSALVLNFMMAQEINQILTIILSILSIGYMVIKIYKETKKKR